MSDNPTPGQMPPEMDIAEEETVVNIEEPYAEPEVEIEGEQDIIDEGYDDLPTFPGEEVGS